MGADISLYSLRHDAHFERFAAWHLRSAEHLDVVWATGLGDDEYRSWAYAVFCRNGEMPADAFGDLLHARKVRLTERAVEILRARGALDGGPAGVPEPWREGPGEVFPAGMVYVGGEPVGSFLWQEIVACVARGVQAHVAALYWEIWPVCTVHDRGLHVSAARGRAGWWCLATDHLVSWVLDPDSAPDSSGSDPSDSDPDPSDTVTARPGRHRPRQ